MRVLNVIAALALLAACGAETKPPTAAPAAETASQEMTAGAPAATITEATLVGRWGDNGDCSKIIDIRADHTFTSYTGGQGTWSLAGDRMTMTRAGGAFEVGVETLGDNVLMIANGDGSIGTSQRCR